MMMMMMMNWPVGYLVSQCGVTLTTSILVQIEQDMGSSSRSSRLARQRLLWRASVEFCEEPEVSVLPAGRRLLEDIYIRNLLLLETVL